MKRFVLALAALAAGVAASTAFAATKWTTYVDHFTGPGYALVNGDLVHGAFDATITSAVADENGLFQVRGQQDGTFTSDDGAITGRDHGTFNFATRGAPEHNSYTDVAKYYDASGRLIDNQNVVYHATIDANGRPVVDFFHSH